MGKERLNALASLLVIVDFDIQNVNSFDEWHNFVFDSYLIFSKPEKSVVLIVSNLFLFVDKSFLKLNFFSDWEIAWIVGVAFHSDLSQFTRSWAYFSLWVENSFQELNLLLFDSDIFLSDLIELSDESIDLNSIVGNLIETFILQLLFFDLNVFVLFLEISVLLLESNVISLSIFEIVDIVL